MLYIRKSLCLPLTEKEWEELASIAKKEGRYLNRQAAWFVRQSIRNWSTAARSKEKI